MSVEVLGQSGESIGVINIYDFFWKQGVYFIICVVADNIGS